MSDRLLFAVAGSPVLHSLSPDLFEAGFDAAGLDAGYLRLAARDASEVLAAAEGLGLSGLNITAPFKQSIAPLLDGFDDSVRRLAAVNCVVRRDGHWIGSNTDGQGVLGALAAYGFDPGGKIAAVLGAGGAGRAAALALERSGCRVILINRTREKAERAASDFGCGWAGWGELSQVLPAADLIVSCVPGLEPVLDPDLLTNGQTVLDAVYPRSTIAGRALQRGCLVIPGEAWLLHQALAAFEIMTGLPAPRRAMARALMQARPLNRANGLALVGFMGAGKSTVGRLVAAATGGTFVDTDALIEARAGLSVAGIFASRGEAGFRAAEREVLRSLPFERGGVYALGGGLVLDRENRARIRRRALTFWIHSDPEKALARIPPGSRPLLSGPEAPGLARSIYRSRIGLYADLADAVVINDEARGDAGSVAERIIHEIHGAIPD